MDKFDTWFNSAFFIPISIKVIINPIDSNLIKTKPASVDIFELRILLFSQFLFAPAKLM